jgi:predicted nucleic acid-binding protein
LKDKADNFLIELALAGNEPKIITDNIRDLEILTPEIFLQSK